ncbi:MAG: hypothetical protein JJT77_10125 [Crocinitomicaceae bacterium]|nr:hypothetical protein [Crocinitomicaceae bacterium]
MKIFFAALFALFLNYSLHAQGIKISENGTNPDATAILELESSNKGFLPPRLTTVERDLIPNPAEGLVIYNLDTKCINFYNATLWIDLCDLSAGPPPSASFSCGDVWTDIRDGNEYTTVAIGNQCWFAENLNYDASGSYCFANDPSNCNATGRLYSWTITMDGAGTSNLNPSGVQGVCPEGWHVPSDAEWIELEEHLGMTTGQTSTGLRTSGNVGQQLKATSFGGTNSSGFNALGSGGGTATNFSFLANTSAYFWTTTGSGSNALYRRLQNTENGVRRDNFNQSRWLSIRCIKD